MSVYNTEKIEIHYFQMTDIWQRFCELHSTLHDQTCDEYSLLLSSDLEKLDDVIALKEETIKEISLLESLRYELIEKVNLSLEKPWKINNVSDLLEYFHNYEVEKKQNYLHNFNNLLLNLIEKIQSQNKKNQVFINKAILSLREIRENAVGKKNYPLYSATGNSCR